MFKAFVDKTGSKSSVNVPLPDGGLTLDLETVDDDEIEFDTCVSLAIELDQEIKYGMVEFIYE